MHLASASRRLPWLFLLGLVLASCSQPGSVKIAVDHLITRQLPDGFFRYEFDFIKGRWSAKDNLVRQAGAAYALAEYLTHQDDRRVREAVRKSLRAFADASLAWGGGRLVTQQGDPAKAKAGATALVLIAGLWYRQVSADTRFDNDLHAWRSGLLALRNPDGLFFSRPGSRKESPYSNGEIWLALAIHAQTFPADRAVQAMLPEVDRAVFERYADSADIGFFHWGLMAAAARYSATRDPRLADFAATQVHAFLSELRPQVDPNSNSCYAVEGMAAALAVLRQSRRSLAIADLLQARIQTEMEKNGALQIVDGTAYLSLGEQRRLYSPELADFVGAFVNGRRRPQSRIDATQHCLSALLKQRALD